MIPEHDSPDTNFLDDMDYPKLLQDLTGTRPWEGSSLSPDPAEGEEETRSFRHYDGDLCRTVYAHITVNRELRYFNIQLED